MSFFNQIGKQLTDLGQKAASSTETFAEVSRLNSLISNISQQLPQQYASLGEAYYKLFKENGGIPQLQSHIEAIKSSYSEINKYQNLILKAKGIEQCPSCGAEIIVGSAFCSNCGAKVVHKESQPFTKICPQCGATVGNDDLFCMSCGGSMKFPTEPQESGNTQEAEEE